MTDEKYIERRADEDEILRCVVGSQSYGTAIEGKSDTDFKGVYISPKEELFGILREQETRRFSADDHSYSLRHFARLATKCVPNVLELLYCEEEDVVSMSSEGKLLRHSRNLFLSKKCVAPYVGYAEGQLKQAAKVPTNRGIGRQMIVEEYGYDTKFASHTIRLLETAKDLLLNGELKVRRPNRDFLLDIRFGKAFSGYDEFREFAYDLIGQVRTLEGSSNLPDKPNVQKINELIVYMHENWWRKK